MASPESQEIAGVDLGLEDIGMFFEREHVRVKVEDSVKAGHSSPTLVNLPSFEPDHHEVSPPNEDEDAYRAVQSTPLFLPRTMSDDGSIEVKVEEEDNIVFFLGPNATTVQQSDPLETTPHDVRPDLNDYDEIMEAVARDEAKVMEHNLQQIEDFQRREHQMALREAEDLEGDEYDGDAAVRRKLLKKIDLFHVSCFSYVCGLGAHGRLFLESFGNH